MAYTIRKTSSAPAWNFDWNAWASANTTQLTNALPRSSDHRPHVSVRLLHDDDAIYGIFRTEDKYVRVTHVGYQENVCSDACVEFFFKPAVGPGYFNLEMNAGGSYLLYYVRDFHRTDHGFADYTPVDKDHGKLVTVKGSLPTFIDPEITADTTWFAQFAIPRAALEPYCGPMGALSGQTWSCNFYKCAGGCSHPHWLTWSPIPECNFHLPDCFDTLLLE